MIELINLTKIFPPDIKVLDNVNLVVPKGQIFGVIGPSGAGKSTLIRCTNLLETPTAGKIIIAGHELNQLSPDQLRQERKKIGMIFQHFNLLSSRTVFDNIALPLEICGYASKQIKETVEPLLELTGLIGKRDLYPAQLSGGQKQRVAIARALSTKPHVLLSDEGTSALDPQTTHAILHLLKNINEQLGVTILLITHEMEVVKEICHRLALMEEGKIIEEADVLEFFSTPKTTVAKQFIRSRSQHALPAIIQQRLTDVNSPNNDILLRLSFVGQVAQEPMVAHIIKNFHLNINILQANIEVIRENIMGVMLIQVCNIEDKLAQAMHYMRSKGVYVEVVGYYAK